MTLKKGVQPEGSVSLWALGPQGPLGEMPMVLAQRPWWHTAGPVAKSLHRCPRLGWTLHPKELFRQPLRLVTLAGVPLWAGF